MASIIKSEDRKFEPNTERIDNYRLFTDISRNNKGINPENLIFDIRRLPAGEFSYPYHFHRYGEELFIILSGSATLRTNKGLEILKEGDLAFFEKGESGSHQLHNHTDKDCTYLDIRTFFQSDICEYPDSNKLSTIPEFERSYKGSTIGYFDNEPNPIEKWGELKK